MNKTFRYFRTHHARKGSLKDNLKDVFDRSAQCADPEILSLIQASVLPMRKKKPFPTSVRPLFLYPHLYEFEDEPEEKIPNFSDSDSSPDESDYHDSDAEMSEASPEESDAQSETDQEESESSSESSAASDDDMEVDLSDLE